MNKLVNFSLTLNPSEEGDSINVKKEPYRGYKLSLYENGVFVRSSYLNVKQWEEFKQKCKNYNADSFLIGSTRNSSSATGKYTYYGEMTLKNCRFYTRPLSAEEIKLNYDTRLAYDEANN